MRVYGMRETLRSDEMEYTVSVGGCWYLTLVYVQKFLHDMLFFLTCSCAGSRTSTSTEAIV